MPVARAQPDNWKIRYAFLSLHRSVLALRAHTEHTRAEHGYIGLATLRETTGIFSHRKYLIDYLILEISRARMVRRAPILYWIIKNEGDFYSKDVYDMVEINSCNWE